MGQEVAKPVVPGVPEKSAREQIRDQKRNIEKSIRNIDRERTKVERDEKKMKAEIKKMVTEGKTKAAKMLAKDIVRMKRQINQMNQFSGQLKAVSIRVGGLSSLNELSMAMEEAGKAIMTVSSKLDAGKLQALSKNLMMEDAKLDMKSEMMTEILDGMGEDMEDESDELYDQVLQECGIEVGGAMPDAKTKQLEQPKKVQQAQEEDSLDAMLKDLQK